jgi:hypothetical protein
MAENKPQRVSEADRAYMRRIGEAKRALAREEKPPASLREMFERIDQIYTRLGALAKPRIAGGDGDLDSHLAYLERRRARSERGE